jgi:hypothetical protein
MNRAAEKAASVAMDIFVNSIMVMNFNDIIGVFKGSDNAITNYFHNTCRAPLYDKVISI